MCLEKRLTILIEEATGGNKKKFAEKAGINQTTLNNYANGRIPKADALEKICTTYKINLNWLVAEIGEKYLTDEKKSVECEFLETVDNWISDLKQEDPKNEVWFEIQFKKLFPEFSKWFQRKNGEDRSSTSISKVA